VLAQDKGLYAIGATSSGIAATVPSTLLLYFCTQTLGISPLLAGAILLLPKLLALIFDPLVGRLLDSFGSYPARRAMLIGCGGAFAAIGFVLTFSPPDLGPSATVIWTGAVYLLFCSGFSLYSVSHIAGPALLVADESERRTLVGWRMAAALVGTLLGAAIAPILVANAGGGKSGYAVMGLIIGTTCLILSIGPTYVYACMQPVATSPSHRPLPLWGALRIAAFRWLALRYLIIMIVVGSLSAASPYWITAIAKHSEAEVGTALGMLVIMSIIAAPLWAQFAKKIGDKRALAMSFAGYGCATMIVGLVIGTHGPWAAVLGGYALMGIFFAGIQVVPFTLIATIARDASGALGESVEGVVTGAWTATEKLALASGPALTAIILAMVGREPNLVFLGVIAGIAAVVSVALSIWTLPSPFYS
jgi:glycoside/pentoside/hexuronide:cation symporter, GPH family